MLYYNTVSNIMRIYSGSAWENVAVSTSGFATLAGVETLTNKTLTSPKINEDVAVTSTATELNLLDGVSGLVQADFTKLAAIDASADEIDTLDALSRGSIIYGNASAATTVLTKGGAGTVLTSDGTDISWSAVDAGIAWQTIVTGSTLTAVAGRGYWIDTTSNTCTITLPSSASNGDQIIFADYARNWGTNKIIIDSNGLNYQGNADSYTVEYNTDGQSLNIVYSDATKGWLPLDDDASALEPVAPVIQKGAFAYGYAGGVVSLKNLVNSSGVVATDTTGVGSARQYLAGATYGGDKGIFAYGNTGSDVSMSNLMNNSGVIASDVTGVGTARSILAAASYGNDKAIFAYGNTHSMSNLVSSSGVISADVTGVGTARYAPAAATYGTDKAIFAWGFTSDPSTYYSIRNLVSNVGVVASDVSAAGTSRRYAVGVSYGASGQAVMAYGLSSGGTSNVSNLVSNTGVIASDTSGVGTARYGLAGCTYGGDKAIYGYGSGEVSMTNLVNNSGAVAADVTGVGTGRLQLAAAGYSYSA